MPETKIVKGEREVEERLADFGTNIAEMVEIARKAAAARADATEDDPDPSPGLHSWLYGTRALRFIFRTKGWKRNNAGNIPSVFNRDSNIKLVFQNADSACDENRVPRSISEKKKASERLVASAQFSFPFPEHELPGEEMEEVVGANIFYYLTAVEDGEITAELSSPRAIENNQFSGFHERIFILNKGDLGKVILPEADDDGLDFDVVVTSK